MIFHQRQWKFLKKSFEFGQASHAYLFCGQKNLGKKSLAIEFAKLINCQIADFQQRPCQRCKPCRDIQNKIHPDLFSIEPINNEIKISQIRKLIWDFSLRPYSAPYKIGIISAAHLMNKDAQNCFLKTLEEPKGNSILILITEFPEALFPTILSRVQRIKFFPLSLSEIKDLLKNKGATEEEALKIAAISLGRPTEALNFLSLPENLKEHEKRISDIIKISNSDLNFRFRYAKDLSEKSNLKEILEIWLRYLRHNLLLKSKSNPKLESQVPAFYHYSIAKLEKLIKLIQDNIFLILNTNINKRLALETLLIEL